MGSRTDTNIPETTVYISLMNRFLSQVENKLELKRNLVVIVVRIKNIPSVSGYMRNPCGKQMDFLFPMYIVPIVFLKAEIGLFLP